jgi:hypothetical protein
MPENQLTGAPCSFDLATLKPFTAGGPYLGKHETGLYPGGGNEMPEPHRRAGERLAAAIAPLATDGRTDARNGRILALVMGHSNCNLYFATLQEQHLARNAAELHPRFELVNGARGGRQLLEWRQFDGDAWEKPAGLLSRPGYSSRQVQVLFLHTTYHRGRNDPALPLEPFPEIAKQMQKLVAELLEHCVRLYPNLKIAYLTCDGLRYYIGLEPHVWREAFAFKWLIESQIKGEEGTGFDDQPGKPRKLPWLCWGPYIWDNAWDRSHFQKDGVHPGDKAQEVFVQKYWDLLRADSVARPWLLKSGKEPSK